MSSSRRQGEDSKSRSIPWLSTLSADGVLPIEVATESPMNVTCCRLELPPGVTPTEHRTAVATAVAAASVNARSIPDI